MTKVQIAMPDTVRDDFLRWLQEAALLHIVEPDEVDGLDIAPTTTSYDLAQVQHAIEFIERIKRELKLEKRRFWQNFFPHPILAPLTALEQTLQSTDLDAVLQQIKTTSETLAEVSAQQHDLRVKIAQHKPWLSLHLTGQQLKNHSRIRHALLILGSQELEHFEQLMEDIPLAAWQVINRQDDTGAGKVYLEVVIDPVNSKKLDKVIEKTQAEIVTLDLAPDLGIEQQLQQWEEQLAALQDQYDSLLKTARNLVQHEQSLKYAYDALLNREAREKLERYITKTAYVSVLTGWIPAARYDSVKATVEQQFPGVTIEKLKLKKSDQPPVLLTNSRLMQPFEAVTNVYGKPLYNELDPSVLLSVFFLIAFGFALTDAGYGLLIMLATGLALRFIPIKREARKMVRLMFYAGAVTVVAGAVTGGWFGLVLEELPPSGLRDFLLAMKLIDPVTEPIRLLIVALLIGIVQLLFATGIKAYTNIKKRDYAAALLDNAAWMSLILAILTWMAIRQGILDSTLSQVALWWIYGSAAVMVLFNGRAYKNIFLRFGTGALSLYGLLSFLGDVLSYSRLLALGLATGIIGLVVNLISGMISDMVPGVGLLLAAVVLIVGHLANLAINTLGAFIHGSRLQFVEFFPKFMEGGGLAFKPFGRVTKYVENPLEYEK